MSPLYLRPGAAVMNAFRVTMEPLSFTRSGQSWSIPQSRTTSMSGYCVSILTTKPFVSVSAPSVLSIQPAAIGVIPCQILCHGTFHDVSELIRYLPPPSYPTTRIH